MSEQEIMIVLIGIGLFIIFGLPIIYFVRHSMKKKRIWREFAENNNLSLKEGRFPEVSGTIDGREINFNHGVGRTYSGRADLQRVAEFTAWAEIVGDVPEGFMAAKKGWAEGRGNLQSEDDSFNKKIRADCPDQEAGLAFLTPERQSVLLELIKFDGYVHGPQESIGAYVVINRSGYKVKSDWFEERKGVLLKTAKAFDNL